MASTYLECAGGHYLVSTSLLCCSMEQIKSMERERERERGREGGERS